MDWFMFQKRLQLAHSGYQDTTIVGTKVRGGFFDFNLNSKSKNFKFSILKLSDFWRIKEFFGTFCETFTLKRRRKKTFGTLSIFWVFRNIFLKHWPSGVKLYSFGKFSLTIRIFLVSVLLSASIERCFVSRVRDFFILCIFIYFFFICLFIYLFCWNKVITNCYYGYTNEHQKWPIIGQNTIFFAWRS